MLLSTLRRPLPPEGGLTWPPRPFGSSEELPAAYPSRFLGRVQVPVQHQAAVARIRANVQRHRLNPAIAATQLRGRKPAAGIALDRTFQHVASKAQRLTHAKAAYPRQVDAPATGEHRSGIGVDLGVKNLATVASLDDDIIIDGPKPLRAALKRLARLNRRLSRKVKGSKNRERAQLKVARCHGRVADVRANALHKLTTWLVRTYGCVVIEDLGVKGMLRNGKLARVISDMGFGEFRRQLTYKNELSQGEVVVADRWFPSSRRCRKCAVVSVGLTLKDRVFRCENKACGHVEDRDIHAARNLERYPGLQGNLYACGHLSTGSAARPLSEPQVAEAGIPGLSLEPC